MSLTTVRHADGRALVVWEQAGTHVLAFTFAPSPTPRFQEIRMLPGRAPDRGKLAGLLADWQPPAVDTGVDAHVMRMAPVGSMLDSLAPVSRPRWPHVDIDEADYARMGFKRVRDYLSHVRQAQIAVYYEDLSRAMVREPRAVIARECFDGDRSKANNNLSLARANGYLTAVAPGVAGGRATVKAHDLLRRVLHAAHEEE